MDDPKKIISISRENFALLTFPRFCFLEFKLKIFELLFWVWFDFTTQTFSSENCLDFLKSTSKKFWYCWIIRYTTAHFSSNFSVVIISFRSFVEYLFSRFCLLSCCFSSNGSPPPIKKYLSRRKRREKKRLKVGQRRWEWNYGSWINSRQHMEKIMRRYWVQNMLTRMR